MCFIHRQDYYNKSGKDAEGNDIRGLAEFIVAKHRSGATDTVDLRFVSQYARFENLEDRQNLTSEKSVESKMNTDAASPVMGNTPPAPPPPNVDFLQGPEDQKLPF